MKAISVRAEETSATASCTYTYCPPLTVKFGGPENLATFFSSYPTSMPENVKAFTITGKDDTEGVITLSPFSPAGNILPANIPFILQNTDGSLATATFTFSTQTVDESPEYAEEFVMGTSERTPTPTDKQFLALGLANDGVTMGFYPYTGEWLAPNRVYLILASTSLYTQVNKITDFVSEAQYVFASADNGGTPAGYFAGYDTERKGVTIYPIAENTTPYLWTLRGNSNAFTILSEDGGKLSLSNSDDLNLQINQEYDKWELVEKGQTLLVKSTKTNGRSLQFSESFFKNYTLDYTTPLCLFRKEEHAAENARSYILRMHDETVNIHTPQKKNMKDEIYDLSGKRLKHPQRGIIIRNGKKIYVH